MFGTGRAYDQIRNTVCYSNLDVKIAPTHAGISVGPDGGSHQMLEDVSLMRGLPNMRVLVPADYAAARAAIRLAAETPGPVYVRMGRASVPCVRADDVELELGRAYVLREGSDATIVACGVEVEQALKAAQMLAAEGVEVEVIDAFSVKPLDEDTVLASVGKTGLRRGCRGAQRDTAASARPWPRRSRARIRLRSSSWACATSSANQASSTEELIDYLAWVPGDCRSCEEGHGPIVLLLESTRLSTLLFERSTL